jgi:hypothetical protein
MGRPAQQVNAEFHAVRDQRKQYHHRDHARPRRFGVAKRLGERTVEARGDESEEELRSRCRERAFQARGHVRCKEYVRTKQRTHYRGLPIPPEEQLTRGIGRKEPQDPGHARRPYGVLTNGLGCQEITVRPGTLRLPYGL